jgi:hypothetical protein
MNFSVGDDSNGGKLSQLLIIGQMLKYCDEEDNYIVEPKIISVSKEQVSEIERLPEDFDFNDVSMEIRTGQAERPREKPPEITNIRLSRRG